MTRTTAQALRSTIGKALRSAGILKQAPVPADIDSYVVEISQRVRPFTTTTLERLFGLVQGVEHIVAARVPGDIVECGVFRGGSMMAAALALLRVGVRDRDIHLFDTFEGMTPPTGHDVNYLGVSATGKFEEKKRAGGSDWCYASLEDVKANLASTHYPAERVHYVKGRVEDTVPAQAPQKIALLRLDTDWYESTKHEMEQLYPRLVSGGVLILDDYGHWQGARKAVDEYLHSKGINLLLSRLDHTGRIALKP